MKRRLLCFVLLLSLLTNSYASGVPGSALGGEIASVMLYKAGVRGFAANDPRFGAALAAVGTAALEVGGAVVAAGTAPAWGTVLASAAIAGAVGYGLQALSNWIFNSNGTTNVPATAGTSPSTTPPTTGSYAVINMGNYYQYAGTASDILAWYNAVQMPINYPPAVWGVVTRAMTSNGCSAYQGGQQCFYSIQGQGGAQIIEMKNVGGAAQIPASYTGCPSGSTYSTSNGCQALPASIPGTPAATKNVADALAGLSDAQKAVPLPPGDVAAIADGMWKQAASQPGYSGLPYVSGDPITAADVSAARAANPSAAVATVGDLASPIASTSPVSLPSTSPAAPVVGTGVNPSTTPQVNLGTDPGIGAPTLETTPTAQAILNPVFNLLPSFRNFVVPAHSGACPKPSMTIFNKYMVMDAHCTVLENIRPTLYAVMFFVWLLLGALIVLAA